MRKFLAVLLGAVFFLPLAAAQAQTWPSRPIRFVIPFGPGSASDALARIVGQELGQALGQPIVVVHKPGADGALSAVEVQRSAPDGSTFLFGTNSPLAVVPNMRKDPPYDVMKDFTPVTFLGDNTYFFAVHPSIPATTMQEFVEYAKKSGKVLNYASGNTFALVGTAMIGRNNGLEFQPVTYKSEPDAIMDVLSGRVEILHGTVTTILPQARDGKLRVLATSFSARSPLMPDVPAFPEVGQKLLPIGPWFALVAPAGLPADIQARMNKEMVAVLAKPNVIEQMNRQGFIPRSSTPEALAAHMKEQLGVWAKALKEAGIEPQ